MAQIQDHTAQTEKSETRQKGVALGFDPTGQVTPPPVGGSFESPLNQKQRDELPQRRGKRWLLSTILIVGILAMALAWMFASPSREETTPPIQQGEFHVD